MKSSISQVGWVFPQWISRDLVHLFPELSAAWLADIYIQIKEDTMALIRA